MIEKGIHDKPRCSKKCRRSVAKFCTTGGERLALSPTVNIDNTWLSSRTNDTPYHVLVTIINLLMFGKCPACTPNNQQLVHVSFLSAEGHTG